MYTAALPRLSPFIRKARMFFIFFALFAALTGRRRYMGTSCHILPFTGERGTDSATIAEIFFFQKRLTATFSRARASLERYATSEASRCPRS
jgi:hypothetical protein